MLLRDVNVLLITQFKSINTHLLLHSYCHSHTSLMSVFMSWCSERAADDATKMKELDCILTEAKNLEAHLTEKKKLLKQTLDQISGKL